MKILRLTWNRMESYGGIQSHIKYLNAALAKRGIDCVTRMLPSESPYRSVRPGDEPRMPLEGFEAALSGLIRDESIDVLHGHNLHLPDIPRLAPCVLRAAIGAHVPVVVTVHDVCPEPMSPEYMVRVFHALQRAGTTFVVTSEFNKERFVNLLSREPAAVIPPGIDFARYRSEVNPEPRTVAYPGRLTRSKGALDAIRILGCVAEKSGPVRILFSDRTQGAFGETPTFFDDLANEIGQYRLLSCEFVNGSRAVPEIYQRAALTLTMPIEIEGFGQVPLESLACCRPVIARPNGGMSWLYGFPGVSCFTAGDTGAAVQLIEDVFSNWSKWYGEAQRGRDLARSKFDVATTSGQYAVLYEQLLCK